MITEKAKKIIHAVARFLLMLLAGFTKMTPENDTTFDTTGKNRGSGIG